MYRFALFYVLLATNILVGPGVYAHDSPEPHAKATHQTKVIWSRTDFAPFFIIKGEYSNQGISDNIIRLFSSKIPGYEHSSSVMSLKRMLKYAESGVAVCHVALLKTPEREKFIDFSQPIMRNYGNGIVTTETGLSKFGLSPDRIEPVDLEALTQQPVTISVHDGRSYSPLIDQIISKHADESNNIFRVKTGLKEHDRLINMLMNNRLDGLIMRPEEAEYSKVVQQIDDPLYFILIDKNPATSIGHVGCTKGDWNKPLLEKIDWLIKNDKEVQETINAAYRRWLPTHLKADFRAVEKYAIPRL